MKGKPGTKAELAALETAANGADIQGLDEQAKLLRSLHAKLTTPKVRPSVVLTPISRIEAALVEHAMGKVLPLEGANEVTWIVLQKQFGSHGATAEDAVLVGDWMARQSWMTGTRTIDQVLKSWPSYLTRARADKGGAAKATHDSWARGEFEG
jgi:hypothetical protein